MIDEQKREKGKYKEVYKKIIRGIEVEITEVTTVGRDFKIMGFERNYNPAIEYINRNSL